MSGEESAELPEGWAWAKLGELGGWASGGTPTTSRSEYWDNGTIPWISAKDMKADYLETSQDSITEVGRVAARLTLLPTGTVLMVVRGMILARHFPVAVTRAPVTINQDLRALIPSAAVDPRFLLRALQLISREVVQATGEATHGTRRLESDRLKAWPIPLPPLAEQRRIAVAIEQVLDKVTSAHVRLERVPDTLKQFRQLVLAAACSGRLTADWRIANRAEAVSEVLQKRIREREARWKDYKTPEERAYGHLPELPDVWAWVAIERIASPEPRSMQSGPFGSNLLHSEFQSEGVLAIGIDNVMDGFFSPGRGNRISTQKYEELQKYTARPLDVLVTVMGTVGRVCVVPEGIEPAIITKHVYRITVDQAIADPHYIALALRDNSVVQPQIKRQIIGQTRPGINGQILKVTGVPLPPLVEQREIVRRVRDLIALADAIERRAELALKRVSLLPKAVIAKAFRGELVPTEAELARRENRSYEPASELLARFKASENGDAKRSRAKKGTKRLAASNDGRLEFTDS